MNSQFYSIYEELYSNYVYDYREIEYRTYFRFGLRNFLRDVRSAIESSELEIKRKDNFDNITLRPDARFFLLSNIHQMFISPILMSESFEDRNATIEILKQSINEDIKKIITDAFQAAKETNITEISGHQIMNIVDQNWLTLNMTSFKVWGDVDN